MKKILACALCVLFVLAAVCSCGESGPSPYPTKQELVGSWNRKDDFTEEEANTMLTSIGFSEEELPYCPKDVCVYELIVFNDDNTYSIGGDPEMSKTAICEYMERVIQALYNNVNNMPETYGEDPDFQDIQDFKDFYAWFYDYETYADFINGIADYVVDDVFMYSEGPDETGKYTLSAGEINFTADGSVDEEYVKVSYDENRNIVMAYSNATLTYTKK
ncbi:MAG: hypothetical protein MJ175_13285 [Clostridia bacterium]|nr:hypothetical protein [Clostridia bacterium]